ncbi:YxeA family protein [Enterococcus sp. LJL99]
MKKWGKRMGMTLIFIVGLFVGLKFYTVNNTSESAAIIDLINPIVSEETFYTKTKAEIAYEYPDAVSKVENYAYIQECYNQEGQKRVLKFVSFGKKLKTNRFLKLSSKGQYIRSWEEVQESNLPVNMVKRF